MPGETITTMIVKCLVDRLRRGRPALAGARDGRAVFEAIIRSSERWAAGSALCQDVSGAIQAAGTLYNMRTVLLFLVYRSIEAVA